MSLIDRSWLLTIISPGQPVFPVQRRPSVELSPQPHGPLGRRRGSQLASGRQPANGGRD